VLLCTIGCAAASSVAPNYMPCLPSSPGYNLPFCNHTLPTALRVKDMIGRMSLAQKCLQTNDDMFPIPEIGWLGYNWNTEVRACLRTRVSSRVCRVCVRASARAEALACIVIARVWCSASTGLAAYA
jgi:hypothetical protein